MTECGANTRHGPCERPSGWGTDHVGEGKCKLHGGKTPIKHGRYSKVKRARLRKRIEEFLTDPDPLGLEPEVALLRAMVEDLINRWDEIYGPKGALLAWHDSFKKGEGESKPRQMIDFSAISVLVDKVGSMVDRIQRHKAEGSISMLTLNRVVEQLGEEVVFAVQEVKLDSDSSTKLLEAIERRWGSIRLEPGSAGDKRTKASA